MVRLAISDNHDEFRSLFEEHRGGVFRFLYRLAGNRHDAEDLLQDTFARFWRKRAQYRGDGSLAGYLRRIAYRTFLNARTRLARSRSAAPIDEVDPADGAAGPGERATGDDYHRFLRVRIREAVDALPDGWREPFVLFRFEGLSMKQIAAAMDLTPKAVELRLARALKRVATVLKDLQAEHGGAR